MLSDIYFALGSKLVGAGDILTLPVVEIILDLENLTAVFIVVIGIGGVLDVPLVA